MRNFSLYRSLLPLRIGGDNEETYNTSTERRARLPVTRASLTALARALDEDRTAVLAASHPVAWWLGLPLGDQLAPAIVMIF